jgi:hypothetical protein
VIAPPMKLSSRSRTLNGGWDSVCSSQVVVLLLQAVGLGVMCLGLPMKEVTRVAKACQLGRKREPIEKVTEWSA